MFIKVEILISTCGKEIQRTIEKFLNTDAIATIRNAGLRMKEEKSVPVSEVQLISGEQFEIIGMAYCDEENNLVMKDC